MFLNLYINRFLGDMVPIIPLVGLLLHDRGFSLSDISLFFLCMSVTVLLFEIPFGILADKTSTRLVIIVSRFSKLIAFIFLFVSHTHSTILLAAVWWGIASALDSGAIQAYTYKLTCVKKSPQHFQKVYSGLFTSSLLGLLTAGIIAAQVDVLGFDYIQYIGIFSLSICLISALLLPSIEKETSDDTSVQKKHSGLHIISKPVLLTVLLVGIFAGGVKGSLDEYTALLLSAKGLSYGFIGYALFCFEITKTFGASLSSKMKVTLSGQISILLCTGLSFIGVFYGNYFITLVLLILVLFLDSILWVHNDIVIQENTPESHRSTVASYKNFGIELIATISFVIAWVYSKSQPNPEHLYSLGGLFLVIVSVSLFSYTKHRKIS